MGGSVALWLVSLPHPTEQQGRRAWPTQCAGQWSRGQAGTCLAPEAMWSDQVNADIRVWFSLL